MLATTDGVFGSQHEDNDLVTVRPFTRFARRQLREEHEDVQELDKSLWATAATTLLRQSATQPGMDHRPLSCPRSTGSLQERPWNGC